MVFFLDSQEQIYARYGGRDAESPDTRQSTAGLRYTMQSVLKQHAAAQPEFAPAETKSPFYIREIGTARGRCIHCHQAREILNRELEDLGIWDTSMAFRYPLPENLGFRLEVDRGNVVETVEPDSAAAKAGLQAGDILQRLNEIPMHSFGDAQFALDKARQKGTVTVGWKRDSRVMSSRIELQDGWKRGDISWRASMQHMRASSRLSGDDLSAGEKKGLGLKRDQLAFRQGESVSRQATAAGIQAGDIILGIPGVDLETDSLGLHYYVESHYVRSETVPIDIIRSGRRLQIDMQLQ
ncbi:MAG: PDZ domain-containing protein [Planctomycetaceae bacterium]|nr:PDZ domain-containing protein [Planctomycetaceae bacterium]